MIKIHDDHFLHEDDLRRRAFGREDPTGLVEGCVSYFAHRRGGSIQRAHRARGRLISAKVRSAAGARHVDEGLLDEFARQKEIIDRLLAFVPRRAPEIAQERLLAIAKGVVREASRSFGPGEYIPVLGPETDPGSSAAHRLTLTAEPHEFDPESWASAAFSLQRWVVENTSQAEMESLRLVLIPGKD